MRPQRLLSCPRRILARNIFLNKRICNNRGFNIASQNNQTRMFQTTSQPLAEQEVKKEESHKEGPMFNKILIANRGEITCRVIKTCQRLGIKTVAVYTDADANSKHVRMADEAVYIGPSQVSESYLVADKILEAMKITGAQAVHPGYGFLSENADFARRVVQEGFIFIGPPASAIHAMGDKIESKIIATKAKVNTVPGFNGQVCDAQEAIKIAKDIGYPVMIKASAGGGGKGMRIAWSDEELTEGFRLSQDEALRNFNSNKMLIEKYIETPRHIEIQIICDNLGNMVYLPERECSIQRRNQKVIEESPSTAIDPDTRKAMGIQAIQLAKEVGYTSAGTVEMLIDAKKNFYFLEMNTRLQVEHPVTEYVTGIDLVEQMIRAAAGLPLSIKQEDVTLKGWATECRVYAEDPSKNFAPNVGQLETYVEPSDSHGNVRVDSGIVAGGEISVYYDPMISKLITFGKDRNESINRMIEALDTYQIHGVRHNIPLLRSILDQPVYRKGDISTNYISEHWPQGFKGIQLSEDEHFYLIAAAAVIEMMAARQAHLGHNLQKPSDKVYQVKLDDKEYSVDVSVESHGVVIAEVNNKKTIIMKPKYEVGSTIFKSVMNDKVNVTMQVVKRTTRSIKMTYQGTDFELKVSSPRNAELGKYMPYYAPPDTSKLVMAPMPGAIVSVAVKPGDKVTANQELVVMEAMKMQNVLKAKSDGVVKAVHVKSSDIVSDAQKLIEFE
ncbi:propionyl-CoA carboxylase alpha chain [Acrasis kona]|uniref:propionyl-CoA carboxylase n=1 Tax=Acrasis kona TaxID=1008807 RepID=A0AAW2YMH2_9EUKA